MISANLSAIFYLISGILFILALRGLSSPDTSRQGNYFGIIGMIIAIAVTFLSIGNFSTSIIYVFLFLVAGGAVGSILGILFTINIDAIRNFLNSTFNLNLFPSEFYYLDKMPTSIDIYQITLIIFFALIISILATVYPAYKASKTEIRGILNNA